MASRRGGELWKEAVTVARVRESQRGQFPEPARLVDEAYPGALWTQGALAVSYAGLGLALLLLDVNETWPSPGFVVRAIGAGLVVGFLAIPVIYWYLARLERLALRATVERDPAQLSGVLNYVGNVGLGATAFGLGAGLIALALAVADQISNPESVLRHLELSPALWTGVAASVLAVLSMFLWVRMTRAKYQLVVRGELYLEVTPLKPARVALLMFGAITIVLAMLALWNLLPPGMTG